MAIQKGALKLKGGMGDMIFTKGKYGARVRVKTKKKTSAKQLAGLKANSERCAGINTIVSRLNAALVYYGQGLAENTSRRLQSKAKKKQPYNERILVLDRFKDFEFHSEHTYSRLGPDIDIQVSSPNDKTINVRIDTDRHAHYKVNSNCFFIRIILLIWNKENDDIQSRSKRTDWIMRHEGGIEGVLTFKRDALSSDYLVLLECSLGKDMEEIGEMRTRGMKIVRAGSLDPATVAFWEAHKQRLIDESNKPVEAVPKYVEKVVKMKRKK